MKVEASKGIDKKSKEGGLLVKKKHYLPLEIRRQLYNEVLRLRKIGFKYKEIIEKIYEKYKIKLWISNIYYWIHGKHHPLGKLNKFDAEPTPELCYVIGTMLGDGCKFANEKHYSMELAVKDKDFAEVFAENLTKVLSKKEPYKPFYSLNEKRWIVIGSSKLLYNFLNKSLEELKPYIEHSKDCVSMFLKGIFDSEGSMYKRMLRLYNTDKKLLNYVSYLLKKYFNIDTSMYLNVKAGKMHRFPNGKIYKTNNDEYGVYIHADGLINFYKYIGFSIKRKQRRLEEAIKNQK